MDLLSLLYHTESLGDVREPRVLPLQVEGASQMLRGTRGRALGNARPESRV